MLAVLLPIEVDPWNSRNLIFSVAPATSARAQRLAVYVPADVVATQFGWSLMRQSDGPALPLVSSAENAPPCPPETRASVIPASGASQPEVFTSKPGLPSRF